MRRKLIGIVTSDKMQKSRRVEVERLYKHPKYNKILRRTTVCHVHDEENTTRNGDVVEIIECRPRSKTKRWELLNVIERAPQIAHEVAVAAASLEGAAQQ